MSVARRLSVLPKVVSSVRLLGTRVEVSSVLSCLVVDMRAPRYARGGQGVDFGFHQGLTHVRVGRAVGVDDVLVGAPGDLEGDVAIAGKQVEYLVLLA